MNNTFNMQRFLWLFNKHTKESYKTYAMFVGVFIAILSFTLGWAAYFGDLGHNTQKAFFVFFLIFSGCVFTSLIFSNLGDKGNAISVLTLPVSTLERFLVGWLYSFIIFQIVFVVAFFTVDYIILSIYNLNAIVKVRLLDLTRVDVKANIVFFLFWFLHSVTSFGSIFFKKLHFVKTALLFFFGYILIIFINQALAHIIIDTNVLARFPFSDLDIRESSIYNIGGQTSVVLGVIFTIITLCLWAATYYKLKEKQV